MALGRRQGVQQELMVPTSALPRSPGHLFYVALNRLLQAAKFDEYVEALCELLYKEGGDHRSLLASSSGCPPSRIGPRFLSE